MRHIFFSVTSSHIKLLDAAGVKTSCQSITESQRVVSKPVNFGSLQSVLFLPYSADTRLMRNELLVILFPGICTEKKKLASQFAPLSLANVSTFIFNLHSQHCNSIIAES